MPTFFVRLDILTGYEVLDLIATLGDVGRTTTILIVVQRIFFFWCASRGRAANWSDWQNPFPEELSAGGRRQAGNANLGRWGGHRAIKPSFWMDGARGPQAFTNHQQVITVRLA